MGKILALAIVVIAVYFAYVQGLPWLEEHGGGLETGVAAEGEVSGRGVCVGAAEQANRALGRELRKFSRPPIDRDAWDFSYQTISREISMAEVDCSDCFSESCRSALSALSEMRDLARQFDDAARGEAQGWSNPATTQERIDSLLTQARTP